MVSDDRCAPGQPARTPEAGDYDDQELLRLLAKPHLTYTAVARRLGLSRQAVGRIACGESRPELQPRIRPLLEGRRRTRRRKQYDDERLIQLLAEPGNTYGRIGRELGLSPGAVGRIARGQARRDLWPRIRVVNRGRAAAKPRREYDDERLIRLLADGGRSYADIGREVGLAPATVGHIARGELRPELQDRIRRAGHGVSRRGQRKRYDDDHLVMLIARGEMTYAQIGQEVGLKARMVGLIARGERRAELQPLIRGASQAYLDQTRRLAARMAPPVITRIFALTNPDGPAPAKVQLEAGETILRYALGGPGKGEGIVAQQPGPDVPGVADEDVAQFYCFLSHKARRREQEPVMPPTEEEEPPGTSQEPPATSDQAPGESEPPGTSDQPPETAR